MPVITFNHKCPVCQGGMASGNKYCKLKCYELDQAEIIEDNAEGWQAFEDTCVRNIPHNGEVQKEKNS